jgi:hypothetical protein
MRGIDLAEFPGMATNRSRTLTTALLGSFLAFAALGAHAASVYECRGADGAIAFQDHACAAGFAESKVEIAPPPPAAPSPDYGRDAREARRSAHASSHASAPARARREAVSYECRAANGELFYRHGACPGRITAEATGGKRGRSGASSAFAVTSVALPRGEVCRRIAAAGSIGRAGHARDESVSTYERNLGRDPCRYY